MIMKKINIQLYGGKGIFGGKETPLNVDIAYCDKCDNCSFYKNGKCFNAGRWKSNCKIGKKENVVGYTSRARKYYDFRSLYTKDPVYNLLEEPNSLVGKCDDTFILNLQLIEIDENFKVKEDVHFGGSDLIYIKEDHFNNDIIKQILDIRPRTMFDNYPIKRYYEEILPHFLSDLKENFIDIYNNFIKEYPQYDKPINYIKRKAYIKSLRNGVELKDNNKNTFIKDDKYLICKEWHSAFVPFNQIKGELKIEITNNMVFEITDNNQVDNNTIFEN